MKKTLYKSTLAIILASTTLNAFAEGTVQGTTPSDKDIMLVSSNVASTDADTNFSVSSAGSDARLYVVNEGQIAGPVVFGVKYKGKIYSWKVAKAQKLCKPSARLITKLKGAGTGTIKLGAVKYNSTAGFGYTSKVPKLAKLATSASSVTRIASSSTCAPEGTGETLGMTSVENRALILSGRKTVRLFAESDDQDRDGLIDILDVDADGDGVLNGYDSDDGVDGTPVSDGVDTFRVFSNLKVGIENSINKYTSDLSDGNINNSAVSVTLAMEVAGGNTNPTELDCFGLTYCSTGGTGRYNSQAFPASFDDDSDGAGLMSVGPTGDFQLSTLVSSADQINAGDAYVEIVTDAGDSSETKVPGMLNFVFRTQPAVVSVALGRGVETATTTTFAYPALTGMTGSVGSPVVAPADWDGKVTVVAYRPQRPGFEAAGEGEYVDLGNSLISIDIPNDACSGGACGAGPGNCSAGSYSTSDANLTTDPNGLRDQRGDVDTDTSTPAAAQLTFTVDLQTCLGSRWATWTSGEDLSVDLQFRSDDGDNAAQKFYIRKP